LVSNGTSFFATWAQQIGASTNTYANRFDIATGEWDALPSLVSDGDSVSAGSSAIGVDAHGNALVAFDQDGDTSRVLVARIVASADEWSAAEPLTAGTDDYGDPHLTVAPNGVAGLLFGPVGRDGSAHGDTARGQYRIFK
jgi:hypothetical protein